MKAEPLPLETTKLVTPRAIFSAARSHTAGDKVSTLTSGDWKNVTYWVSNSWSFAFKGPTWHSMCTRSLTARRSPLAEQSVRSCLRDLHQDGGLLDQVDHRVGIQKDHQ